MYTFMIYSPSRYTYTHNKRKIAIACGTQPLPPHPNPSSTDIRRPQQLRVPNMVL